MLTSTTLASHGLTPAVAPGPIDVEQRIKNGFAGMDPGALGFSIAVIVVAVLLIVACIVVAIAYTRKRRAQRKLFDAYGEGKPMQSFETVTAKPSTALGDDSDDEPNTFGSTPPPAQMGATPGAPAGGIKVEPLTDSE